MPIPEKFYDIDGNEVSLELLCKIESAWAANQIRMLHKQYDELFNLSSTQPVNTDTECQYANLCSPTPVKCTESCHNHPDNKKGEHHVRTKSSRKKPLCS